VHKHNPRKGQDRKGIALCYQIEPYTTQKPQERPGCEYGYCTYKYSNIAQSPSLPWVVHQADILNTITV
jgi:hypothetical protein